MSKALRCPNRGIGVCVQYRPTFTAAPTCDCSIPTDLSATADGIDTIDINWTGNDCATSYELRWSEHEAGAWTEITGLTDLTYELTGLDCDTEYDFQARSECDGEYSEWSGIVSQSTEFSPLCIDGLKLWLKADAGVTKDESNYVSSWADQSGNGNTFTQSNGSYQPLYEAGVLNGKPAIKFDGSNDYMIKNTLDLSGTKDVTIFIIFKTLNTATNQSVFQQSYYSTSKYYAIRLTQSVADYDMYCQIQGSTGSNAGIHRDEAALNTFDVRHWFFCNNRALADKYEYWKGNVEQVMTTDPSLNNTNDWGNAQSTLGSLYYAGYSAPFDGYICEILLYNNDIGAANATIIYNYFKSKYAL